ncbi:MAG TPA: transketolase [Caulobacteraceae bacterium]|jgi:transketolase|nr:transketolase [Caulobacteraceae bacterium]
MTSPESPSKPADTRDLDKLAIDTIRTLAIDAVQKADSGHAGAPMGLAPVAYTLWTRFLHYDPSDPHWPGRDRFVLSCGHASMLLYAILHLTGVEETDRHGRKTGRPAVSLEDIENFRELGSVCAGHPEYGLATGVETTTGPLGQGCASSVGMAISQKWLSSRYDAPDRKLFDYDVYAICSDGDMMEGIASEAASTAGHLRLSNLCWIWDNNTVTIEGHTELAFDEDVAERFRGYGWMTVTVDDANDCEAFARAVDTFKATDDRPTLIVVKSVIGYGSPNKQGTSKIHSDPLGVEEVRLTKQAYGWDPDKTFFVPDGVPDHFGGQVRERGARLRADWNKAFEALNGGQAGLARELQTMFAGDLPQGWDADLPVFAADAKGIASREASGKTINALAGKLPWLMGGSADLAPSTKTKIDAEGSFEANQWGGRNLHFGVREHAMGAIANGMAVSKLRPYTGTFLVFSDYMKGAMRLAALMEAPVVFVFTHDSIGVGQDGPTHQPIEQLIGLRAIPGMRVFRPGDANETAQAWRFALAHPDKPAVLALSRQALPTLDRTRYAAADGVARGGYVVAGDPNETPRVILIATGSELHLAIEAHERLSSEGVKARVVSLPSWEVFEEQDKAYRDQVLPPKVTARVAVEAGSAMGWDRYAGHAGEIIAMHSFGSSAPIGDLMKKFGFTADHVYEAARRQLEGAGGDAPARVDDRPTSQTHGGAEQ